MAYQHSVRRWARDNDRDVVDEVKLGKNSVSVIHKVFLDHTGHHLIVSTRSKENYYLHSQWKKFLFLKSLAGEVVRYDALPYTAPC